MNSSTNLKPSSPPLPSLAAVRAEKARRSNDRERQRVERNAEKIRERCQSLYEFVREFWPILEPATPFKGGWAIKAVCDCLEAVTAGRIQYLLITIPPGMAKSLIVSVFWPAWEWGPKRRPELRILSTSYSRPNVIRDNNKMRRLVASEKYQQLWGDIVVPSSDKWGEQKFENEAQGFREGRPFVSMTGGRGDRVIVDDPHSVDSAESDLERQSTVRTFREAIPDRVNDPATSAIVVIMQRLHAKDVAGEILALGLPYVHLNLPMEFEGERSDSDTGQKTGGACTIYLPKVLEAANDDEPVDADAPVEYELFFRDPRTEEGELLFPERFNAEAIARLKKSKGSYAWAGQYQQRPTAREGGIFKRKWFEGKIVPADAVPASAQRCRAWDRAGSKVEPGKAPDFSAGVRMARSGADYYVEHVKREQDTPGAIRKLMRSLAETDPEGTILRVPKEPSQAGIDQAERDVEYFAGHRIRVRSISGDKVLRAEDFSVKCEFGNVYIVAGEWNEAFLDELCAFPAGANDDQVDAAADAYTELAGGSSGDFEAETTGGRTMDESSGRDSRYNFGDMNSVAGFGVGMDRGGAFG